MVFTSRIHPSLSPVDRYVEFGVPNFFSFVLLRGKIPVSIAEYARVFKEISLAAGRPQRPDGLAVPHTGKLPPCP